MFIAILAAGFVGFEAAIFRLAQIGTCASGGPYVIGSECPSGTGWWIGLLLGSVVAIVVGTFGAPALGGDEKKGKRPWIPVLAFVPFSRECAVFSVITAVVILTADRSDESMLVAAVLAVAGPACWLGGRALMQLANSPRPRDRG